MSDINMALLNDFIDEAREHLDEMESLLLQLGDDSENLDILNNIFRTIHNIKGGSQLTGLVKVSTLAHRLEDLLDLLRNGEMTSNDEIIETLIEGRDRIVQLVSELESVQEETSDVGDLVSKLTAWIDNKNAGSHVPATPEVAAELPVAKQQSSVMTSVEADYDSISSDYQEEYDQELFGIFISHLKRQFAELLQACARLNSGVDQTSHLQQCDHIIASLRGSANYMGYEAMVALYDTWHAALEQFIELASSGTNVPAAFMDDYIDELIKSFPQLQAVREDTDVLAADMPASADETAAPEQDDVTAEVMAAFGFTEKPDVADEEPQVDQADEQVVPVPSTTVANVALFDDFIEEADQYLDDMETLLIKLENEPGNIDLLNDVFRNIHNIKGGSQLTGLDKISRLALRLEDLLDLLRNGNMVSTVAIVDTMISVRDRIVQLVRELEDKHAEESPVDDLIDTLSAIIEGREQAVAATGKDSQKVIAASYDEENDRELFAIFIDHLKEQLAYIAAETQLLLQEPVQLQRVAGCSEAISRLRSSANYMGYEELTDFYDKWTSVLDQVSTVVAKGETVSLDFMDQYLDDLVAVFPQVSDVRTLAAQNLPSRAAEPDTSDTADIAETADTAQTAEEEPHAEKPVTAADLKQPEDVDALFNRLNSALEQSMQQASAGEIDTLHGVYDELVSSSQGDMPASPVAPVQNQESPVAAASNRKKSTARKDTTAEQQKPAEVDDKKQTKKDAARAGENKIRKSVRVDAEKIDALMNQVGELVVDRSYFFQLFNEMRSMQQYLKDIIGVDQKEVKMIRAFTYRLGEAISALGRTSNELQEGVMKMRMMPISNIFNRYPRLVHDLTRNTDKKVKLEMYGEDTELDKMIVEELSDPLIHIIRNAIDHGLETTDERLRNGKPEVAKLVLDAYQESNHIVIEVTDDGRGISTERIKDKAISKGMYTADELERFSHRDLIQLIMAPGFSTAEKITGTSGRGVGMDVVKKNIEKLNGTLEIDSKQGIGTQMRLKIPLTLAIIHALMIRVGKEMFTIPLSNVDETVRINQADTSIVEGVEVIHLRGEALPIFHLSSIFNVDAEVDYDKAFVVIVETDGKRTGFVVDELLGQEEVVIKPLADYVQEKSGFSGATIIGDGRISLILDVYELVKMTAGRLAARHKMQTQKFKRGLSGQKPLQPVQR